MSAPFQDFASSTEAKCDPEPIKDSLRDILRDAVQQYSGPVPCNEAEFKRAVWKVLDRGLAQASEAGADVDMDRLRASEMLADVLLRLKDIIGSRLYVHALLIVLGKLPDSEEAIARQLGVSKAAVSKAKITVQEFFDLPCRVGRTPASRAKFTALALARQHRKHQAQWPGQHHFQL